MQKLGSARLVCKLRERHHPSHLVCHSPPLGYKVFVIVISGLPLFPRIMFFHSITWTPRVAMYCNRATFLSHGQGGAPSWSKKKNSINHVVYSSRSFTHVTNVVSVRCRKLCGIRYAALKGWRKIRAKR